MMDRQQKLKVLVDKGFGGNQAKFAKAIKRSPAQVNHWLTGHRNLGDAGARHIEIALMLGIGFFDDKVEISDQFISSMLAGLNRPARQGPKYKEILRMEEEERQKELEQAFVPLPPLPDRVPIVSWEEVYAFAFNEPEFHPYFLSRWTFLFDQQANHLTLAIEVDNESMKSKEGLSFEIGDIIIFQGKEEYKNQDLIVAIEIESKAFIFKQLIIDAGRWYLKSLNPDYPMIATRQENLKIVGKVIQRIRIDNFA